MTKGRIDFVGAGPGDPELITVKGKSLVETADIIVYAGSLVNPAILEWADKDAEIHNSAGMDLEEIVAVMKRGYNEGKRVVRLHTGDPSIYGAIAEQMLFLDEAEIDYNVIPGVSSFLGATAALKKELTIPEITQTVILSRCEGRTPVPEKEKLVDLASHEASLILFLSVTLAEKVQEELLTAYSPDTPVAIVYKATWEDEKVYRGDLVNLASLIKENNIRKTALIFVGRFLAPPEKYSKLYDRTFSHGFRKAKPANN